MTKSQDLRMTPRTLPRHLPSSGREQSLMLAGTPRQFPPKVPPKRPRRCCRQEDPSPETLDLVRLSGQCHANCLAHQPVAHRCSREVWFIPEKFVNQIIVRLLGKSLRLAQPTRVYPVGLTTAADRSLRGVRLKASRRWIDKRDAILSPSGKHASGSTARR